MAHEGLFRIGERVVAVAAPHRDGTIVSVREQDIDVAAPPPAHGEFVQVLYGVRFTDTDEVERCRHRELVAAGEPLPADAGADPALPEELSEALRPPDGE